MQNTVKCLHMVSARKHQESVKAWERHSMFKAEGCLFLWQSSDLMPLRKSHAYFHEESRAADRKRDGHQTPSGLLYFFLAFQSNAAIRPGVWPWLLNATSPNQPRFKTRGWDAPCLCLSFFLLNLRLGSLWKRALCVASAMSSAMCARSKPLDRWPLQREDGCPQTAADGGRGGEHGGRVPTKIFFLPSFWTRSVTVSHCLFTSLVCRLAVFVFPDIFVLDTEMIKHICWTICWLCLLFIWACRSGWTKCFMLLQL